MKTKNQKKVNNLSPSKENIIELITNSLEESKAMDITVIDIDKKSDIASELIIASGSSSRHVASISDNLIEKLKQVKKRSHINVEGKEVAQWVVVDIGDIMIHIFQPEIRELYNLEDLWNKRKIKK